MIQPLSTQLESDFASKIINESCSMGKRVKTCLLEQASKSVLPSSYGTSIEFWKPRKQRNHKL